MDHEKQNSPRQLEELSAPQGSHTADATSAPAQAHYSGRTGGVGCEGCIWELPRGCAAGGADSSLKSEVDLFLAETGYSEHKFKVAKLIH